MNFYQCLFVSVTVMIEVQSRLIPIVELYYVWLVLPEQQVVQSILYVS